jgi:hypothetical protein
LAAARFDGCSVVVMFGCVSRVEEVACGPGAWGGILCTIESPCRKVLAVAWGGLRQPRKGFGLRGIYPLVGGAHPPLPLLPDSPDEYRNSSRSFASVRAALPSTGRSDKLHAAIALHGFTVAPRRQVNPLIEGRALPPVTRITCRGSRIHVRVHSAPVRFCLLSLWPLAPRFLGGRAFTTLSSICDRRRAASPGCRASSAISAKLS